MIKNNLSGHNYIFIEGEDKNLPTVLLLHGTGGDEYSLLEIGKYIFPKHNLLSVRGNVLEGSWNRYFKRYNDGSFDLADFVFRAKELEKFIKEASEQHEIKDIIVIGYSNGANMALGLNLSEIKKLILFRPAMSGQEIEFNHLTGKQILILAGDNDELVSTQKTKSLTEELVKNKAVVETIWRNSGHGLDNQDFEITKDWLKN